MGYGEKEIDMLDWKMSTYPDSKIIQEKSGLFLVMLNTLYNTKT